MGKHRQPGRAVEIFGRGQTGESLSPEKTASLRLKGGSTGRLSDCLAAISSGVSRPILTRH
ncbi:hypothetical protein [Pannonibacter phragmitetus]|uniref:hypothetical protein n=1 Tax=Pannonibacter phragmitetus TaxID=121719 RepID=UPI003D2EE83E